jgi:hypothetical protein
MEDRLPVEFHCPITHEIMKDPVIAIDGHSYERSAIQKWFQTGQETSPKTNNPLSSQQLYPNHALRNVIEKYDDDRSLLLAELSNIRQAIRREIAAGEKCISIINALDTRCPTTPSSPSEIRKRKRSEQEEGQEKEAEAIGNDNFIIEMAISDRQSSLELRKSFLSEMLERSKVECRGMLREQEVLSRELKSNREQEQLQQKERQHESELASKQQNLSDVVKNRINLETISLSDPNLQLILDGYAKVEAQCRADIEALEREHKDSIRPLRNEASMKRTQIQKKLSEIDATYPTVVLEAESLQSQFRNCVKDIDSLEDLKLDINDAVQWTKETTNGMYVASVHTLAPLLLSFKLHARLELQSGKDKTHMLANGFSPKRLRRFGVSLREMMGASTDFTLHDLKEGGYTILEMNQEGITLQDLANSKAPSTKLLPSESMMEGIEIDVRRVVSQESSVPLPIITSTTKSSSSTSNRTSSSPPQRNSCLELSSRKKNGFTATQARGAGYKLSLIKEAEYSAREVFLAGYSLEEMKAAKFSARAIKDAQLTAKQQKESYANARFLHLAGYPTQELFEAGYSYEELQQAGCTVNELHSVGRSAAELVKYFGLSKVLEAGISIEHTEGALEKEIDSGVGEARVDQRNS